ncbi:hypothetical protein JZ751_015338 [Albula glossodonta]|uniref:Uncharacterized protein n=1 Tax=Albula glossodonta TaxID=121402 RepID=A0A8T2N1Q2_9TELE|nr:hypothetical protein JZ751_015338 [Albula glossodonta]
MSPMSPMTVRREARRPEPRGLGQYLQYQGERARTSITKGNGPDLQNQGERARTSITEWVGPEPPEPRGTGQNLQYQGERARTSITKGNGPDLQNQGERARTSITEWVGPEPPEPRGTGQNLQYQGERARTSRTKWDEQLIQITVLETYSVCSVFHPPLNHCTSQNWGRFSSVSLNFNRAARYHPADAVGINNDYCHKHTFIKCFIAVRGQEVTCGLPGYDTQCSPVRSCRGAAGVGKWVPNQCQHCFCVLLHPSP